MRLRRTSSRPFGAESGSALVFSAVIILSMAVMSYGLLRVTSSSSRRVGGERDDQQAFYLAEAGMSEAHAALRAGFSGAVGSFNQPAYLGGGVLWVAADDLGNGEMRYTATAMSGSGRAALETVVKSAAEADPLFGTSLNSKEDLTLNQGVLIDSYNSSLGTYASQATAFGNGFAYANPNGDVRSNKSVILNANASVFGDAVPGPSYSTQFNNGSYVMGSTTPASTAFIFPPIVVPVYPNSPSISLGNGTSQALAAGDYDMDSLSIGKNANLHVTGPANIVVRDFTGGKDAGLTIDATNGPVTFYVQNSYTHTNGFEAVPAPGSPMTLAFMVEAQQNVVFPANTAIRGAYYLPEADIVFSNANECWGAFAANRISMANSMRFHFDEDLLEYWKEAAGGASGEFEVLSWREVPVQPDAILSDRRDPLTILGVKKSGLPSPSAAWDRTVVQ